MLSSGMLIGLMPAPRPCPADVQNGAAGALAAGTVSGVMIALGLTGGYEVRAHTASRLIVPDNPRRGPRQALFAISQFLDHLPLATH